METRHCQNCKKDFTIEPDDFSFYDKMKVPAPTWCPPCRFERRISFMNIYSLYKSTCDNCNQNIISMYNKDSGQKVFCSVCWWGDSWDGTEYALDYDPKRNFFEQLIELKRKTPCMALDTLYSSMVNTPYANYASYLKNCYGLFFADYAENCFYSDFLNTLKDTSDSFRIRDSELCHDCVGLFKCFGCIGCDECDNSVNLIFSKNCSGCTDCFGCINIRKKSYCIFNEQYSKEAYEEFMQSANLNTYSSYNEWKKKSKDFWLTKPVRVVYGNSLNVNTSGEYIYESKNTKDSYMVTSAEDCRYIQLISVATTKDCYDYTCWGGGAEKVYDSLIVGHSSANVKFSMGAYPDCFNVDYAYYVSVCKNVFGCANLKRKSYCILNKEYSKEEYLILKDKIIDDMANNPFVDSSGRIFSYGEFMPYDVSSFGYNETFASVYFQKEKDQAINSGYRWSDVTPNEYVPTMLYSEIPDFIDNMKSITEEVLQCLCGKCFKITDGEVSIFERLKITISHMCPDCRRKERFSRALPPKLYSRTCMKCDKNIQTSYSPNRPEIIYCEKCYQEEIM